MRTLKSIKRNTVLRLFVAPFLLLGLLGGALYVGFVLPSQSVYAEDDCPCTIFGETVPENPNRPDDGVSYELGVRFQPVKDGYITGVRFYKDAYMTGTHTGRLWSPTGMLLATGAFENESESGWQELSFSEPKYVSAGSIYTASISIPTGKYIASPMYFSQDRGNDMIQAPGATSGIENGVYGQPQGTFPESSYNNTNYWVDVNYTSFTEDRAPLVKNVAPSDASSNVSVAGKLTINFDQPLDASTVNEETISLKNDQGVDVDFEVNYESNKTRIVITPSVDLSPTTTFTAVVKSGEQGVKNIQGVPLLADYRWSFTTQATNCPCMLFSSDETSKTRRVVPDTANGSNLGVQFSSEEDGYISSIRFYKSFKSSVSEFTVGLWSTAGNRLAVATSSNTSASGWQEITFDSPVQILKDAKYIASVWFADGIYASSAGELAEPFSIAPLSVEATAGRYGYSDQYAGTYPNNQTTSNYWITPVFTHTRLYSVPLTVEGSQPSDDAYGVDRKEPITVKVSTDIDTSTLASGVRLYNKDNSIVPGSVAYEADVRRIIFTPSAVLDSSQTYSLRLESALRGASGQSLSEGPQAISFTTGKDVDITLNNGKGGSILVVTGESATYSNYLVEILRTEGINYFTAKDVSELSQALMNQYDSIVLGSVPLAPSQSEMLTAWVEAGGNLIAMRPDASLRTLFGLSSHDGTQTGGYIGINTTAGPGKGLIDETLQYHSVADQYTPAAGVLTVATLYSDEDTSTTHPAVTHRKVGRGSASAFTYNLPESIALTHQGNTALANGMAFKRSDSLFHTGDSSRPDDWLNVTKARYPQADEQQRLFVNILQDGLENDALPKFWYLPHGYKSVVGLSLDNHVNGGSLTLDSFAHVDAMNAANCSRQDWTCVQMNSYIYSHATLTAQKARVAQKLGMDLGAHLYIQSPEDCTSATSASALVDSYNQQLTTLRAKYTGINNQLTSRNHCYAWPSWTLVPEVDRQFGIKMNFNYVWYPQSWTGSNVGRINGSGMTMRYTDLNGQLIDSYQGVTDFDYETDPTRTTIRTMLDDSIGDIGSFGAFGTHFDDVSEYYRDYLLAEAASRQIPVISNEQLVTWKDAQSSSTFNILESNEKKLVFTPDVAAGGQGMVAMLPTSTSNGTLGALKTEAGEGVSYATVSVKERTYAVFPARPATYTAEYGPQTTAPVNPDDDDESETPVTPPPLSQPPANPDQTSGTLIPSTVSGVAGKHKMTYATILDDEVSIDAGAPISHSPENVSPSTPEESQSSNKTNTSMNEHNRQSNSDDASWMGYLISGGIGVVVLGVVTWVAVSLRRRNVL